MKKYKYLIKLKILIKKKKYQIKLFQHKLSKVFKINQLWDEILANIR